MEDLTGRYLKWENKFLKLCQLSSNETYKTDFDTDRYVDIAYRLRSGGELMPIDFIPNQSDILNKHIKDKWYKLNNNWYAKYCNNIIRGEIIPKNHFRYTESITMSKIYGKHSNVSINYEDLRTIELADMDEVSKYLPEGHPDKIQQKVDSSNDSWCVDIREIDEEGRKAFNNFKINGLISFFSFTDIYYGISGINKNSSKSPFGKQLSKEEFYKKIGYKPIEEQWIPKVGDWVKLKGDEAFGQVTRVDMYVFYGGGYSSDAKDLVKMLPNEIPSQASNQSDPLLVYSTYKNFKLGDWVVSLRDFISFKKGSVGQITEVNDGYGLKAKSIKIGTQTFTDKCADEFRLATQEEIGKHLIEEAKKRYPPDTLFYPAHLPTVKYTCLRRPEYHFYYEKGNVYLRNEQNLVVNMNSGYSYCVYHDGNWAKVVNQSMSKEELLAKAKRDYPVGTKFKSAYDTLYITTCKGNYEVDFNGDVMDRTNMTIYRKATDNWAEIISKPEVKEEVKSFTVGGWVRIIKSGTDNGISYKIGEYYQIVNKSGSNKLFYLEDKPSGKRFLVSNSSSECYGTECEWIGMENPIQQIFSDKKFEEPLVYLNKNFILEGNNDVWTWKIDKPKSKVNELKVLSQQIPVVFKKKVKKHYLQII